MDNGTTGLLAGQNSRLAVRNCSASNNSTYGLRATSAGVAVDTCTVQNNGTGLCRYCSSTVLGAVVHYEDVIAFAEGKHFTDSIANGFLFVPRRHNDEGAAVGGD